MSTDYCTYLTRVYIHACYTGFWLGLCWFENLPMNHYTPYTLCFPLIAIAFAFYYDLIKLNMDIPTFEYQFGEETVSSVHAADQGSRSDLMCRWASFEFRIRVHKYGKGVNQSLAEMAVNLCNSGSNIVSIKELPFTSLAKF